MDPACRETLRVLARLSGEPLSELEQLAARALVGVVSSTYRTCGKLRCRCMRLGEKHGPHLYVSYWGEEGLTTGFYVPQRYFKTVEQGLAAWSRLDGLLRRAARQLRRSEGRAQGSWRRLRRPLRELAEANSAGLQGVVAQERRLARERWKGTTGKRTRS